MLLSRDDYLRLASHAVSRDLLPALPDAGSRGLAGLVVGALDELRKREAVLPGLRARMAPDARDLLTRLAALAPADAGLDALPNIRDALTGPPIDEDSWGELVRLLDRGAHALLGNGNHEAARWLRDVAEWELAWYAGFDAAPAPAPEGERSFQPLTPEKLQAHLRARLPERPDLRVTDFRSIAGGFSNETYFFTLEAAGAPAQELVVRKNAPWPFFSHWAHDCAVESRVLAVVAEAGLPVPRPLWLFTDLPDVDGNFYIMTRGAGHMVGTLAGADESLPEKLLLSLAEFLARLHAIPTGHFDPLLAAGVLPTRTGDTIAEAVRRNLQSMRAVWEKGPRLPSPGEAFAFDWLLSNVPANGGRPAVVHTDCFVHNFLVEDDEIACVVDWEASHLGDPAEDLAYVKDQISLHMEWDRFLAHYRACGGAEIDESTLAYYKCLLNFRNYFGSNIGAARITRGYDDIRMIPLGSQFFTIFMQATIEATRPPPGEAA